VLALTVDVLLLNQSVGDGVTPRGESVDSIGTVALAVLLGLVVVPTTTVPIADVVGTAVTASDIGEVVCNVVILVTVGGLTFVLGNSNRLVVVVVAAVDDVPCVTYCPANERSSRCSRCVMSLQPAPSR